MLKDLITNNHNYNNNSVHYDNHNYDKTTVISLLFQGSREYVVLDVVSTDSVHSNITLTYNVTSNGKYYWHS